MKSDKTKRVAIMKKEDYKLKIEKILNEDNTYRGLRIDPLPEINKNVINYVEKLNKNKFINKKNNKKNK